MSRVVNISDKFSTELPVIQIGEKAYTVETGMETVLKFEELTSTESTDTIEKAISIALGDEAAKELNVRRMPMSNIKVLITAIFAAMLDVDYDVADARFQGIK